MQWLTLEKEKAPVATEAFPRRVTPDQRRDRTLPSAACRTSKRGSQSSALENKTYGNRLKNDSNFIERP
jgi:hypothetical protein